MEKSPRSIATALAARSAGDRAACGFAGDGTATEFCGLLLGSRGLAAAGEASLRFGGKGTWACGETAAAAGAVVGVSVFASAGFEPHSRSSQEGLLQAALTAAEKARQDLLIARKRAFAGWAETLEYFWRIAVKIGID